MRHYTKQQKQEYFKNLRNRWNEAKKIADNRTDIRELYEAAAATGAPIQSYYSFAFVAIDMKAQGLDGYPYIDMKTFHGWKENGFKVKKGEHSTASGITWIGIKSNEADSEDPQVTDDDFVFPKEYKLFHRSQVEPIQHN